MGEILKIIFGERLTLAPPGFAEHFRQGYLAGSFGGRDRGPEQGRVSLKIALRLAIRKSPCMVSCGGFLRNRETTLSDFLDFH
jgi:hypothetical protein